MTVALILETGFLFSVFMLLAVLFLLVIPVTISFSIVRQETFTGKITVEWFFGLLRYNLASTERIESKKKNRKAKSQTSSSKTPNKTSQLETKQVMKLLRNQRFMKNVLKFLRDLLRCVRLISLEIAGRFGLDNPYDTGRLWGNICAFTGFLHGTKQVQMVFEPEFNEAVFELESRGVIRIIPVTLLLPTTMFVLSPSTIRAAWSASRDRE